LDGIDILTAGHGKKAVAYRMAAHGVISLQAASEGIA
jgi:hypothetical protein